MSSRGKIDMSTEIRVRFYKTCVKPIWRYGGESQTVTISKTKALLNSRTRKTLKTMEGVSLSAHIKSNIVREDLRKMRLDQQQ